MKWKIFGNVIKLIEYILANMEFMTEFHGTFSKCVQAIRNF